MFDAIAPTYECVNTVASAGRDRGWRRRMVELAGVRLDDVLLDIACGTGDVARTFAAAPVRPRHIVGLDFSFPMLRLASGRPITSAQFCGADALRLPVCDASVTITTCAFGIRNFQDLAHGLREMHRVLRPGGRAVILEFSVPRGRLLRSLYLAYINKVMPAAAAWISRDKTGAYRYLPRSVVSFADREEVRSSLLAAGFCSVQIYPLTLGIVAVYIASKAANPGRATS
jgi:demethylmenaquinone methyltransferase/2-methoxy-6-polyprenyl-1,4-benzoquinol methylase